MKRTVSILLCAFFLFPLTACETMKLDATEQGKYYTATEIFHGVSEINGLYNLNGKLYFTCTNDYVSMADREDRLYTADHSGENVAECAAYYPHLIANAIAADSKGDIWISGRDNRATDSGDVFDGLFRLSADGELLESIDYGAFKLGDGYNGYLYSDEFVIDSQDTAYFSTLDGLVKGVSLNSYELIFETELKGAEKLCGSPDGKVFAFVPYGDGQEIVSISPQGELTHNALDMYVEDVFSGDSEADLYLYTGGALYAYDFGTNSAELFMPLLDNGFLSIQSFIPTGDGRYIVLAYLYDEKREAFFYLKKYNGAAETLSIAKTNDRLLASGTLRCAVASWNRTHPETRIEIMDYSGSSAGSTALELSAAASGGVKEPDMVETHSLPVERYITSGLFADLSTYVDSGALSNENLLFPSVREAMTKNGGLYEICASFTVETYSCKANISEKMSGRSFDALSKSLSSSGAEYLAAQDISREEFINWAVALNMNSLIDWENRSCHFDEELFRGILELSNYYPTAEQLKSRTGLYSEGDMLESGSQLLCAEAFSGIHMPIYLYKRFGDDFKYIGFPSAAGNGCAIHPALSIAVMESSENKDECVKFLQYILSEDFQRSAYSAPDSLPANKAAYDAVLAECIQRIEDVPHDKISAIYADAEAAINGAALVYREDSAVLEIVSRGTQAFIGNTESINEASGKIQKEINAYVDQKRSLS